MRLPHLAKCLGKLLVLTSLLFSYSGEAHAQGMMALGEDVRGGFRSITAALLALSSDDSLSGGTFKLKSDDPSSPDSDLVVLKTYVEIPLTDPKEDIVPLVELNPSYLKLEQEVLELGASTQIDSFGLGAGLGLRMKFIEDLLQVTPRFKVKYSRVNFEFAVDGIEQSILDDVSPKIDAWTYLPSLDILLKPKLNNHGGYILLNSNFSFLFVHAKTTNSQLGDFGENSEIWKNSIAIEQPVSLIESMSPVIFRPSFALVQIYGDAREGFEFNNFYEIGLDVFSLTIAQPYFSELGFGVRYIYEDEIQGWRFGLFGDFS